MYHSIKKHSLCILCALFIYSSTYAMHSAGGSLMLPRGGPSQQLSPTDVAQAPTQHPRKPLKNGDSEVIKALGAIARMVQKPAAFWDGEGRPELAQHLLKVLEGFLKDKNFTIRGGAAMTIAIIVEYQPAVFWETEDLSELA